MGEMMIDFVVGVLGNLFATTHTAVPTAGIVVLAAAVHRGKDCFLN